MYNRNANDDLFSVLNNDVWTYEMNMDLSILLRLYAILASFDGIAIVNIERMYEIWLSPTLSYSLDGWFSLSIILLRAICTIVLRNTTFMFWLCSFLCFLRAAIDKLMLIELQ